MFSQVYNPEQQLIAEIERMELEARSARRRIEHAQSDQDKRVLNRLLTDLEREIEVLRERLAQVLEQPTPRLSVFAKVRIVRITIPTFTKTLRSGVHIETYGVLRRSDFAP